MVFSFISLNFLKAIERIPFVLSSSFDRLRTIGLIEPWFDKHVLSEVEGLSMNGLSNTSAKANNS
jgi:hypothetical protein